MAISLDAQSVQPLRNTQLDPIPLIQSNCLAQLYIAINSTKDTRYHIQHEENYQSGEIITFKNLKSHKPWLCLLKAQSQLDMRHRIDLLQNNLLQSCNTKSNNNKIHLKWDKMRKPNSHKTRKDKYNFKLREPRCILTLHTSSRK